MTNIFLDTDMDKLTKNYQSLVSESRLTTSQASAFKKIRTLISETEEGRLRHPQTTQNRRSHALKVLSTIFERVGIEVAFLCSISLSITSLYELRRCETFIPTLLSSKQEYQGSILGDLANAQFTPLVPKLRTDSKRKRAASDLGRATRSRSRVSESNLPIFKDSSRRAPTSHIGSVLGEAEGHGDDEGDDDEIRNPRLEYLPSVMTSDNSAYEYFLALLRYNPLTFSSRLGSRRLQPGAYRCYPCDMRVTQTDLQTDSAAS